MYSRYIPFVSKDHAVTIFIIFLSFLWRFVMTSFTFGFHNLRFYSFFSTASSGLVDITRLNMVFKGSARNDGCYSNTLSTSVWVWKASRDPLSTMYPCCSNIALSPAKYVLQIHCLFLLFVIADSSNFGRQEEPTKLRDSRTHAYHATIALHTCRSKNNRVIVFWHYACLQILQQQNMTDSSSSLSWY